MSVAPHAARLEALVAERILLLDGAMGTMIQRARLAEEDYRGQRFRDWGRELKGNNELLSLTQPALVRDIHAQYLQAGADIIETNTFNSTAIALADYGMRDFAREFNRAAAKLATHARRAAEAKKPPRPPLRACGPRTKSCPRSTRRAPRATRTPDCRTPSASTTTRPRRWRHISANGREAAGSTSSAAAATPRRSISARWPTPSAASPRGRFPRARARCASPG